jgi:2-C-methyl-D-erythritol 4-phosphate cytidylyltransferase
MSLSEEALARLADVVALQPTKNAELQERWGLDSGSEVHEYLESELEEYYYRDENSLICATPEAPRLVDGETDENGTAGRVVRVPALQARILEVIAGPDEEPQSVVSVLHALEDAGTESDTDAVRSALRSLVDKGVVERVRLTVPTFRLAVAGADLDVRELD